MKLKYFNPIQVTFKVEITFTTWLHCSSHGSVCMWFCIFQSLGQPSWLADENMVVMKWPLTLAPCPLPPGGHTHLLQVHSSLCHWEQGVRAKVWCLEHLQPAQRDTSTVNTRVRAPHSNLVTAQQPSKYLINGKITQTYSMCSESQEFNYKAV